MRSASYTNGARMNNIVAQRCSSWTAEEQYLRSRGFLGAHEQGVEQIHRRTYPMDGGGTLPRLGHEAPPRLVAAEFLFRGGFQRICRKDRRRLYSHEFEAEVTQWPPIRLQDPGARAQPAIGDHRASLRRRRWPERVRTHRPRLHGVTRSWP